MAREPKKAIPEKAVLLEHLARKVAVLLDTEEPMVEQLQAHDQLDLLYDMGATASSCFGQDGNRRDQGRAPDPRRHAGGKTK